MSLFVNILKTGGLFKIKCAVDIHGPQMMNPKGDPWPYFSTIVRPNFSFVYKYYHKWMGKYLFIHALQWINPLNFGHFERSLSA